MIVILNQQALTLETELQSLMLYGCGVYTSFALRQGKVKGLKMHLERLQRDSKFLFGFEPSRADIRANMTQFIAGAEVSDAIAVRITIFAKQFSLSQPERIEELNILVTGRELNPASPREIKLMRVECDRPFPTYKTTDLLVNLQARRRAREQGYSDALLTRNGLITEGATWNIFFVKDSIVYTPPVRDGLLPGILRRQIIENAAPWGMELQQTSIPQDSYTEYDCCFIGNSVVGISPVAAIENKVFHRNCQAIAKLEELYGKIPDEEL